MTSKEKMLYQQIHPLKLAVDFSTGFYTTYLLWLHDTFRFLLFFILPSIIITVILVRMTDLEKLKNSAFGRYVAKYMTTFVVIVRSSGQIMMWVAAWYHSFLLIVAGLLVIIGGWVYPYLAYGLKRKTGRDGKVGGIDG